MWYLVNGIIKKLESHYIRAKIEKLELRKNKRIDFRNIKNKPQRKAGIEQE